MDKKRILFVAENVTLAQVVRLVTLANTLDRSHYEVHFACSEFPVLMFAGTDFVQHELETIDKERVFEALAAGRRIYERKTLRRYVEAELELIDSTRPDLIVGDFRLSLATSAPLRKVPCAALINAYWSPYAVRERLPVPDHPIVKLLGERLTEQYFPRAVPRVFKHFAAPINATRKRYGLHPVGSLLEVLTFGNYTLYVDDPQLVPVRGAPDHHRYLGPVLWSPNVAFDEELLRTDPQLPLVYVTLGSSGKLDMLPLALEAIGRLPLRGIVATAGRSRIDNLPSNCTAHEFVPGDQVARAASLVISNGGSSTGYQALNEGTPVLGIASNFDQYLAMEAIERAQAGVLVKARSASADEIANQIRTVLTSPSYQAGAARVRANFERVRADQQFPLFVREALEQRHSLAADQATHPGG